ncbi:MAG: carbon starvation protein A [Treponema sp.]|jgi:carbon starvation protein CstA|nr:carbon starvation protein A [Treponema sp.]
MFTFLIGMAALIFGYVIYSRVIDKSFGPNPNNKTPAHKMGDGVDYVPIPRWKALGLHFINITGTGPIFGPIAGALFGPAAFIWIVLGCILAGAVHDYMIGMISVRHNGTNVAEIVGKYLGNKPRAIMRVFSIVLLLFVGVVFVTTPAQVLNAHVGGTQIFFLIVIAVIIVYYIIATLLPIHLIIARVYPIFGALILFMGIGMLIALIVSGDIRNIPEFSFQNMRPDSGTNILARIFPFLFITIACGAISGFHATQAPIVARCLANEKEGRLAFYGGMIGEGLVAMIWAAVTIAAITHLDGIVHVGTSTAVAAPLVVRAAAIGYLGVIGGTLAIVGVVLFPITSGDTAFRSARLILADSFKFDQKPAKNRLMLAIPLFAVAIPLVIFANVNPGNFGIIWRYFAWSNQTLATIALWAAAAYMAKIGKNYWFTLLPAAFMTSVVIAYFFTATETIGPLMTRITGNFEITYAIGLAVGITTAVVLFVLFVKLIAINQRGTIKEEGGL